MKKRGAEAPLFPLAALRAKLELQAKGEFELAWNPARRFAGDGARRLDAATRITRVDVVERVERIHAELGDETLADGERLGNGKVRVKEPGTKVGVAARVPNGVQTRVLEDSRAGIGNHGQYRIVPTDQHILNPLQKVFSTSGIDKKVI